MLNSVSLKLKIYVHQKDTMNKGQANTMGDFLVGAFSLGRRILAKHITDKGLYYGI